MNISSADSIDNAEVMDSIDQTNRKLASIQKITAINDIPGADKIQVAQILGWQCVVKKSEFNVGDLVVYFECDSILPQKPEFEFMRERKFRVKIIKLRKQISEGLVMPLSILPLNVRAEEGLDLTSIIGVTKHDPEGKLERSLVEKEKRSPFIRFLMNIPAFRYIYLKLNTNVKGSWPVEFVGSKTDETRIQTCAKLLMDYYDQEWYISEKLDGQSGSFFTYFKKVWGRTKKCFGICSRNIWIKTPCDNNYWNIANKLKLKDKLIQITDLYSIQGELIGGKIQGNKYRLSDLDLFIFNVIKNGLRVPLNEALDFCKSIELKFVPIVCDKFVPLEKIGKDKTIVEVVNHMVELSRGKSILCPRNREGIVVRLSSNPTISFKVINPDFLLEEKD